MHPTQDQTRTRALSDEQIDTLILAASKKKGFRELPVRNFLSTLYHTGDWRDKANAHGNMEADARIYRWTPAIVLTIAKGIRLAYK